MKEFHVLIVDDEIYSIKGIQAGVLWGKLGISTIYTAQSMKQAKEIFVNNRVDLLLCDIEMPKGSGLELVKWVREYYPATEVVFLTCHSEFEYAKQAIQLKSYNYLLKPVDYQELEQIIRSALEKIKKEKEEKESYLQLEKSHHTVLLGRFWSDLINQVIPSRLDEINKCLNEYQITYPESTVFLPILIRVQRWKERLSIHDEKMMDYAFQLAVKEELVSIVGGAELLSLETGYILVILPSIEALDTVKVRNRCDDFISQFVQFFTWDLCCYIGNQVKIYEIVGVVQQLQELDRNNVTINNQSIELKKKKLDQISIPQIPLTEWTNYMKSGAKDKLSKGMMEYFSTWRRDDNITARSLHLFYQDFLQLIFYILQVKGIQANQVFSQNLFTEKPEKVLKSLISLQEWAIYVSNVTMNQVFPTEEKESVVEVVKQFIHENIGEHRLTRDSIANHVYLNPDYLTRIFKKETGLSLTEYLQQQRIEYAKGLLLETNLSISEIALASGYSNFSYFSTVFKKATQLNPGEYRRTIDSSVKSK